MSSNIEINFDAQTADHGFLTFPNGDVYDVYGDTKADFRSEVAAIIASLGVNAEVMWNFELPEA